jgi:hypothetical protein
MRTGRLPRPRATRVTGPRARTSPRDEPNQKMTCIGLPRKQRGAGAWWACLVEETSSAQTHHHRLYLSVALRARFGVPVGSLRRSRCPS